MNGILFKPWKIKAIAESSPDREWQTRRLDGLKEINKEPDKWILYDFHSAHGVVTHTNKPNSKGQFIFWQAPIFDSPDGSYKYIKPRYQASEMVYLKEAHYRYGHWVKNGHTKSGRQEWAFKGLPELITLSQIAGTETLRYYDNPPDEVKPNSYRKEAWYKRSPLFMPEWAARYFIKITDVRAERLQEISGQDIRAEGLDVQHTIPGAFDALERFSVLWDSINPKYPWASNPWVWVYTFKQSKEETK